jgi:hypothetical protein
MEGLVVKHESPGFLKSRGVDEVDEVDQVDGVMGWMGAAGPESEKQRPALSSGARGDGRRLALVVENDPHALLRSVGEW